MWRISARAVGRIGIWRPSLANDYVFVTNDRRDFLREYARVDVHSGLIIIIPDVKRADQRWLFEKALGVIAQRNNDIVNQDSGRITHDPRRQDPHRARSRRVPAFGRAP